MALVVTAATLAVVAPADAAARRVSVYHRSENNKCLDVANYVSTTTCSGASGQQWTINPNSIGETTFVNYQTGLCLDSNSAGDVYAISCNGGAYQRWYLAGTGGRQIRNAATERCLDGTGGNVITSRCNDLASSQAWTING
ncbi:RICIN domain-containing protein [Micromonospora sp. NPDC007271]|uniref:RICIN domain-containing protein n=1 Tax=Micromonospora sp. NPDC007271 TaxID=3154587 RepID=UPI0033FAA71D